MAIQWRLSGYGFLWSCLFSLYFAKKIADAGHSCEWKNKWSESRKLSTQLTIVSWAKFSFSASVRWSHSRCLHVPLCLAPPSQRPTSSAAAVYLKSSVVSRRERGRVSSHFKRPNTKAILSASRVVISYCTPQRGIKRLNITSKIRRGILTYTSGTSCVAKILVHLSQGS